MQEDEKVDRTDDLVLQGRIEAGRVIAEMVRDAVADFSTQTGRRPETIVLPASARSFFDCHAAYDRKYAGPWPMVRYLGCDFRYGPDFRIT